MSHAHDSKSFSPIEELENAKKVLMEAHAKIWVDVSKGKRGKETDIEALKQAYQKLVVASDKRFLVEHADTDKDPPKGYKVDIYKDYIKLAEKHYNDHLKNNKNINKLKDKKDLPDNRDIKDIQRTYEFILHAYEIALMLNPNDANLLTRQAEVYREFAEYYEFIAHTWNYDLHGFSVAHKNAKDNYEAALRCYERVKKKYPSDEEIDRDCDRIKEKLKMVEKHKNRKENHDAIIDQLTLLTESIPKNTSSQGGDQIQMVLSGAMSKIQQAARAPIHENHMLDNKEELEKFLKTIEVSLHTIATERLGRYSMFRKAETKEFYQAIEKIKISHRK